MDVTSRGGTFRVVPQSPERLIDPDETASRGADEAEEFVTELFGPDPAGSPSWLDAALVVAGTGLVVWSLLRSHSTVLLVVGAILACLGLVLPLRSGRRLLASRRRARRRESLLASGVILNIADPLVRRLAESHDALLRLAPPSELLREDVVNATHLAVIES